MYNFKENLSVVEWDKIIDFFKIWLMKKEYQLVGIPVGMIEQ